MLRIDVPTDSLPVMVKGSPEHLGILAGVLSVPDTLHHDYFAELVFDHTVTAADSLLVLRLGGWPEHHEPGHQYLDAIIPDSIVPTLRQQGLINLFLTSTGCGA